MTHSLRHSWAPCTVLAAKDRVYGHAPLMAVYQSKSYHRRVLAKETIPDGPSRPTKGKSKVMAVNLVLAYHMQVRQLLTSGTCLNTV